MIATATSRMACAPLRSACIRPPPIDGRARASCIPPMRPPMALGLPVLNSTLRMPGRHARASMAGRRRTTVVQAAIGFWPVVGIATAGVVIGMLMALTVVKSLRRSINPLLIARENAQLRDKVGDLESLLLKLSPMQRTNFQLRFERGVNRTVILGIVDAMLQKKEVNIWWLPDDIERVLYTNVISLMLNVMDEVVSGMNISFAGHNVKMQLTYLQADSADAAEMLIEDPEIAATLATLDPKTKKTLASLDDQPAPAAGS